MVKKFTISISDWVYNRYSLHDTLNRSKLIEELIVLGAESTIEGKQPNNENLEMYKKVRALEEENQSLKRQLQLVKAKKTKKELPPEVLENLRFGKSLAIHGLGAFAKKGTQE